MKRLLVLAMLFLLVMPVCATISPIKVDFQGAPPVSAPAWSYPFYLYEAHYNNSGYAGISSPDTTGHQTMGLSNDNLGRYGAWRTTNNELFTYAAWSEYGWANGGAAYQVITLYYQDGSTAWDIPSISGPLVWGRWEVVMSGNTAYIYLNDAVVTSKLLTQNPAGIRVYGGSGGWSWPAFYYDDFVIGYASDATVIGTIPSNYFILYDSVSPASTGLYRLNTTPGGPPVLINSNNFGLSYGRPFGSATTLQLINPSGSVHKTYPVYNMSCQVTLPISDLQDAYGNIAQGRWSVSLADDAETSYFYAMAGGATVGWNANEYLQEDTASITYSITDGYWGTYDSYRIDIIDIYGTVKKTESVTTQTGTKTLTFDSTYDPGVYYAAIIGTDGGVDTWLNYDSAELLAYIAFSGNVYNAETTLPLNGATVSVIQSGLSSVTLSSGSGNYSTVSGTAFGTGASMNITVSATGYTTYNYTFVPIVARSIPLDFALVPSPPTFTGQAISGVTRDSTYGNLIPSTNVAIVNTTYGESYAITANSRGYYLLDETDGAFLLSGRCYLITGSKTGYGTRSYTKCIAGV